MAKLKLTRNQLASFLPDHETIKQFESLITIANETLSGGDTLVDLAPTADINNSVSTDYIDFAQIAPHTNLPRRLTWNETDGTLDLHLKGGNVTLQVGQEQVIRVVNKSGSDLIDGQVVYLSGAQGNRVKVDLAVANGSTSLARTVLGLVTESIPKNQEGFVTINGLVRDLNTSAFTDGDVLYLSTTPGAITNVAPTPPIHRVVVGFCVNANPSVGSVLVSVQPGYDLEDLSDVAITTPVNNDVLSYYSANQVWKNTNPGVKYAATYGISASNTAAQNVTGFAAMAAAGPGRFILPSGTIQLNDTITLPSYQSWHGAGVGVTTLRWTSTGVDGCIKSKNTTCVGLYGLTLDDNNLTTHPDAGVISFNSIVNFTLNDFQIINMFKYGIGVDSCNTGTIANFEIIKNFKTLTQNQAINISNYEHLSLGGPVSSGNIVVGNGTCRNTAILSLGEDIWFKNVSIYGWSFGAGIVVEVSSNRGGLIDCMATDGTGVDSPSGYRAGGFEIWGVGCIAMGLIAVANDGMGIDWGSENGVLANSYCANNGRGSTLFSGISARYGAGGIAKASGSLIVGCRCVDTGAGTQKYGYTEESASLANITVKACSFIGNVTAPTNILSSSTVVDTALSTTTPANVGTAAIGTGITAARADHVHAHGAQAGGTTHADATTSVSGFMSGADKTKLDTLSNGAILSVSQAFAGATIATGSYGSQSTTLAGVVFGDFIEVGFSFPLLDCSAMAFVTAANSVQCVFYNNTGSSKTLASGTIYFRALKR